MFSIAKFFTYHFDHHRNRIYMALLSWNLYFHDILNKIKKNIPALNCIFFCTFDLNELYILMLK